MRPKAKILFPTILALLIGSAMATDFTYKEYAKAPEAWKRGFLFGMSQYMSAVAQPDEEPPYPVRTAFKRCLGPATDSTLVRHVDTYVAAHPEGSNGPVILVIMRALFDFCRVEISKIKPDQLPRAR
jgi:hypothetical protein